MLRRLKFFVIGSLISIIFLSMGPEHRLKDTFYAYVDISIAALPTAFIASAEKTTGTIPPINNIARTGALKILIPSIPVKVT